MSFCLKTIAQATINYYITECIFLQIIIAAYILLLIIIVSHAGHLIGNQLE